MNGQGQRPATGSARASRSPAERPILDGDSQRQKCGTGKTGNKPECRGAASGRQNRQLEEHDVIVGLPHPEAGLPLAERTAGKNQHPRRPALP